MNKIGEYVGKQLVWQAVKGQKSHYELRCGNEVLGTLAWDKSEVRGTCGGTTWRIAREGFFRPRLLIRQEGEETPVGTLEVGALGSGRLAVANGPTFKWVQRGMFSSTWGFVDEAKSAIVSFKLTSGLLTSGAEVTLEEKSKDLEVAAMLAVLGWYVLVLYSEDAAPAGL